MSTLAEIEAAVVQLPPTQQETLFAFLAQQLGRSLGFDKGGRQRDVHLNDLAAHAEPMGALTNAEIDRAVYGR